MLIVEVDGCPGGWVVTWDRADKTLVARVQMVHKKRRQAGNVERAVLLEEKLGTTIWPREEAFEIARPAKPDDVLDAAIAAWTARRVAEDNAERLPTNPPMDRRGLRMAIDF